MKSEKFFLQNMWVTVSKLEFEEHQKELAKIKNKQFIKRQLSLYACMVAIFCFAYLTYALSPDINFIVYVFCLAALVIGYVAETLLTRTIRRNY